MAHNDPPGRGREFDADLQQELDAALGDLSIWEVADREVSGRGPTAEGVRRGVVIAVQRDDILVDMGGKSTGVLPIKQLRDEPIPEVGDTIEVTVTGYDKSEGILRLSRQEAVMAAAWQTLHVGQVLEGRVTGHNKGGLELSIDGLEAFMPISQIDVERIEAEDLSQYTNRRLQCEVFEFSRGQKKLVVSRRNLLHKQAAQAGEKRLESLKEGDVVTGTVRSIMPYGAFVDIGGVDGLLHIGDMSHSRVEDPNSVVKKGQQLELRVLKVDRQEKRIGLGLKQILADPWTDVAAKWPVDSIVSARITKLMDFGAFAELEPGVEGLIPISEMSYERRIHHPKELVSENDVVKLRVLSLDPERKRLSLSLKQLGDDPWMGASARWPENSVVQGTVTRLAEFGAFVELAKGVEGLIHISELSDGRIRNASEVVREGDAVSVKVLEVDEDRRRISLSVKQVALDPEYTGPETAEPDPVKPKRKKPLKGGLEW